jgi:Lipase (class 3)
MPGMPDFLAADNSLNPRAVFACTALLAEMYGQGTDVGDAFAQALGAQIVYRDYQPGNIRPFSALYQLGDEYLWVINGTATGSQMIVEIFGGALPLYDTVAQLKCSSAFFRYAGDMLTLFDANVPSVAGKTIRICGHSYGSALALVAAVYLANRNPAPAAVQALRLGTPRVYSPGTIAGASFVNLRLNVIEDPVQFIPPQTAPNVLAWLSTVTTFFSPPLRYAHHGRDFYWSYRGAALENLGPERPSNIRLTSAYARYVYHWTQTHYLERAANWWIRNSLPTDPLRALLAPAQAAYGYDPSPLLSVNPVDVQTAAQQRFLTPPYPVQAPAPPPPPSPPVGQPMLVENIFGLAEEVIRSSAFTSFDVAQQAPTQTWQDLFGMNGGASVDLLAPVSDFNFNGPTPGTPRTFWLFRGRDRCLLQSMVESLSALITRDGVAADPKPTASLSSRTLILDGEGSAIYQSAIELMQRCADLQLLQRVPGTD